MGTIAKSSITLSSISDAYSVSLSPSVCVIHADFDGSNPVLTNAYTIISVYCGEVKVPFTIKSITASHESIAFRGSNVDDNNYQLTIKGFSNEILEGYLEIVVDVNELVTLQSRFSFSVERESTMLDWIKDWESNKTTIGGDSIITPKLFVGKKITGSYDTLLQVPELTGVYIGPSSNNSCGIYGYKKSIEIFHLDEEGGSIGGWEIGESGLNSPTGLLSINSNGSICSVSRDDNGNEDVIWEIREDGSAHFSKGNVKFEPNGYAEFNGVISASGGNIAGWSIDNDKLYCIPIALSSDNKYIAVANIESIPESKEGSNEGHFDWVKQYGGVAMFYTSSQNYGFVAYSGLNSESPVFSAGSTNSIAGWNFDNSSLYLGTKNNTAKQYTDNSGSLTIGTEGMRGNTWFIDTTGSVSFIKGLVTFGSTSGNIVGWNILNSKIATNKIALSSSSDASGIYLTASDGGEFIEREPNSMESFIRQNGGLYLNIKEDSSDFAAYDKNGHRLFQIQSGGINYIGGWCFDDTALYTGNLVTSGFTESDNISISGSGIRGYKWRLEKDGSGALAGGNISWGKDGNVNFDKSVKLGWDNLEGTIIDSNGILTGKISADNITSGTISTANIRNEANTWYLKQDGSGALANGNISWGKDGSLQISGNITASSGKIGEFSIDTNGLYYGDVEEWENDNYDQALSQIVPGVIRLQHHVSYSNGNIARIKVAIGNNAEPGSVGIKDDGEQYCRNVGYFYRRMMEDYISYYPAVKIISNNVAVPDVALYTQGAVVFNGGVMEIGRILHATKPVTYPIDLTFGTTITVLNSSSGTCAIDMPTLKSLQSQLGIGSTTEFCVPVKIINSSKSSHDIYVGVDGDSDLLDRDGGKWMNDKMNRIVLAKGDSVGIALTFADNYYYGQVLDNNK